MNIIATTDKAKIRLDNQKVIRVVFIYIQRLQNETGDARFIQKCSPYNM